MKNRSCRPPLLAIAAFFLVFPLVYKRRPRVMRRTMIKAKPSEIFGLIKDPRQWPLWTEWNRQERLQYSYSGESTGTGAVVRWCSDRQSGTMTLVSSVENERVAYHLELEGCEREIEGRIVLEPVGENYTQVTWYSLWSRSSNPYGCYLDFLIIFSMKRDFAAGLSHLKELAEASATPASAD
jgi:hypothetical protein